MGAAASGAKLRLKTVGEAGADTAVSKTAGEAAAAARRTLSACKWLCEGSVQGPELGRKTVGETCKDAGASAGHSRELALEVRSAKKAVVVPFRAGTWNSEQGSMRWPAGPRTSSLATEP